MYMDEPGRTAIKNFHVLNLIEIPEKFGGMKELKVDIGNGSVICMAENLLPIDEKIILFLYGSFRK